MDKASRKLRFSRWILINQAKLFRIKLFPDGKHHNLFHYLDWVVCAATVSSLYIIVNMLAQYNYDDLKSELNLLEIKLAHQNSSQSVASKKEEVRRAEQLIKNWLGGPFIQHTYATETGYCIELVMSFVSCIVFRSYIRYKQIRFGVANALVDPSNELKELGNLVEQELRKFLLSSDHYMRNIRTFTCTISPLTGSFASLRDHDCGSLLYLVLTHLRTREQVEWMAGGVEVDLYNKSAKHLNDLALCYLSCWLFFTAEANSLIFLVVIGDKVLDGEWSSNMSSLDLLSLTIVMALAALTMNIIIYFVVLTISGSRDQVISLMKLRQCIRSCMDENCTILRDIIESREAQLGEVREMYDKMNANLARVYLRFKVFLAQLEPELKFYEALVFFGSYIIVGVFLILLIHKPLIAENYWLAVLVTSLSSVLWVNIITIPMCNLYGHCLGLTRGLFSLLSHTVELEERCKSNRSMFPAGFIYDEHTCWLLRQEICNSDLLIEKFRTKVTLGEFEVEVTYQKLVKLNFWLGIWIISLLMTNGNSSLSSFEPLLFRPRNQ